MLYTLLVISNGENGENILQLIFNYENTKKKVVAIPCMQTQAQSRTSKHTHTHSHTHTHTHLHSTCQHIETDFLDLNEAVWLTACAQVLCAGVCKSVSVRVHALVCVCVCLAADFNFCVLITLPA